VNCRVICVAMLISLAAFACSNRQVYEAIQYNRQLECQKGPQSQYEECMERAGESYESYKKKREQDNHHG